MHVVTVLRSGRCFADRDRERLQLVRPHLRAAIRRCLESPHPYRALRLEPAQAVAINGPALRPDDGPLATLTERELTVLTLLAEGLTVGQSARRLDISPRTVDKHLEHVHAELRVTNRVDAVAVLREPTEPAWQ